MAEEWNEDWEQIEDVELRKRVQNRLAQRKHRRKAREKARQSALNAQASPSDTGPAGQTSSAFISSQYVPYAPPAGAVVAGATQAMGTSAQVTGGLFAADHTFGAMTGFEGLGAVEAFSEQDPFSASHPLSTWNLNTADDDTSYDVSVAHSPAHNRFSDNYPSQGVLEDAAMVPTQTFDIQHNNANLPIPIAGMNPTGATFHPYRPSSADMSSKYRVTDTTQASSNSTATNSASSSVSSTAPSSLSSSSSTSHSFTRPQTSQCSRPGQDKLNTDQPPDCDCDRPNKPQRVMSGHVSRTSSSRDVGMRTQVQSAHSSATPSAIMRAHGIDLARLTYEAQNPRRQSETGSSVGSYDFKPDSTALVSQSDPGRCVHGAQQARRRNDDGDLDGTDARVTKVVVIYMQDCSCGSG